jgi:hypothetical protein
MRMILSLIRVLEIHQGSSPGVFDQDLQGLKRLREQLRFYALIVQLTRPRVVSYGRNL